VRDVAHAYSKDHKHAGAVDAVLTGSTPTN
jgi:hypothetical protein